MDTENFLDIPQFRTHLKEMQVALKEGMIEDDEHPEELDALVSAMGRLEKELANKASQNLLSDFFMVYSFLQAFDEESEDDEDDDFDDEFEDEDEDER